MITFVIFLIMRAIKFTILLLSALFSLCATAQKTPSPKYEYRAVWLTTIENLDWPKTLVKTPADTLAQQRELTSVLDSLHSLGVNTVLLQTRVRGDVIYPSAIEPFSHVLTGEEGRNPGYDALAFAVRECHKRGMQLHAWVVSLPLGKAEHIKRMGKMSLVHRQRSLCSYYDGSWYMEPGNPATADYLCSLVAEIVKNYDVDGLHLDYIRYPDRVKNYPDAALHRRHGKGLSLPAWRRANITAIARRVCEVVKELKPWVRVSCAPLGKYGDLAQYSSYGWNARETVFQEAQNWMRDGYMDILFPMLYFKGNNFYPFVLDWQENSHGRHIVPGVGVYRLLPEYGGWQPVEIARQLNTSRSAGTAGSALFRAHHLLSNAGGAAELYSSIYAKKALVPPLNWAAAAAPATPAAFALESRGDTLALSWQLVPEVAGHPLNKYNLYVAVGDTVDIDDVDNLLCDNLQGDSFVWACRTTSALSFALTAVDAYGRESVAARLHIPARNPRLEALTLPEPFAWGQRLLVHDVRGKLLYSGRYSTSVNVSELACGYYRLTVTDRDGAVLWSDYFKR